MTCNFKVRVFSSFAVNLIKLTLRQVWTLIPFPLLDAKVIVIGSLGSSYY